jgi:hypothetical protein
MWTTLQTLFLKLKEMIKNDLTLFNSDKNLL